MIKLLLLFLIWLTVTKTEFCPNGCRLGPVKMAPYICRCRYYPDKNQISSCIRHCANDVFCRLCPGNPWYGIPSVCPLVIENEVDLSGENYNFIAKEGLKIYGLDKAITDELFSFDPLTLIARAFIHTPKLKIEMEYQLNGILFGDKSHHSKGCLTMRFDDVSLDWYPYVDVLQKCNQTYFSINGSKSNLTLINNKPVTFEFHPDCKLSKCFNRNWYQVLEKMRIPLQKLLSNAGTYLTNSIILQSPLNEVFDFSV